jgi:hypothetical protein
LTVYVPWDVIDYYENHVKLRQDKERVIYPNPKFGSFSKPLTVVDSKGRILLWYLPGLVTDKQQVVSFFSLKLKLAYPFNNSPGSAKALQA